eukprot:TRINITY_DN6375_c0_g1_i1.p2 TRINITY_DN6375_c0_g1~~TRINITY_DN6375_c0_g1_i1.p2  ORF type:complete len:227 (+),score=74.90 TRINITY_DN6375_c0_g1_i1:79-759(+)
MLLSLPKVEPQPKRRREEEDEEPETKDTAAGSSKKAGQKTAGKGTDVEQLVQRIQRLELMVSHHDDSIRNLEAVGLTVILIPEDHQLSEILLKQNKDYQAARPTKGPHPWGPPRRGLGLELVKFLTALKDLPADCEDFVKKHQAMKEAREIDMDSVQLLSAKETRDGPVLLRIRPQMHFMAVWKPMLKVLVELIVKEGGELKTDEAPPGPVIRQIRKSLPKRKNGN